MSAAGLFVIKKLKIWTKSQEPGWGVLKFVKDNSIRHIDIETPCWKSWRGIIFRPLYSFIHGANPVKSISLACLRLNEALVELKWFGQLRPTCVVFVSSQFNPLRRCWALRRVLVCLSSKLIIIIITTIVTCDQRGLCNREPRPNQTLGRCEIQRFFECIPPPRYIEPRRYTTQAHFDWLLGYNL